MTIMNEDAWERGRQASIKANATIGRQRRWLAEDATRQRFIDFANSSGEFAVDFRSDCDEKNCVETGQCWGHVTDICKATWDVAGAFGFRMQEQIWEWGSLTEKQEAAMIKIFDRACERVENRAETERKWAEEHAAAAPCPSGRTEITGTIISTDLRENAFGSQWKMLVRDDSGFKVWGSVPSKLFELCAEDDVWPRGDDLKGKRITFTAAVEVSDRDEKFGFFKRPTKTKLVAS